MPEKTQKEPSIRYRIQGGVPLRGNVTIGGSKNAALPLLAASILIEGESIFHNVPRLRDIETMLEILSFLGAKIMRKEMTVSIDATDIKNKPIPHELVAKLRGSIVVLGPLLARFGRVEMAYPGGCVIGKRPVMAHTIAFEQLGIWNMSNDETLILEGTPKPGDVILPEFSVTATENILLAAARTEGTTTIHMSALEPHVKDVEKFIVEAGAQVRTVGPHVLEVIGKKNLVPVTHTVVSDYLEAGAFITAGLATKGHILIHGIQKHDLTAFLGAVKRAGGQFRWHEDGALEIDGRNSKMNATRIQTNIFPGFPTDLQAPFGVLMTQAEGVSRVFEVLFEGRMAYLYELEKMGAQIEILNSHQALIIGPVQLRGRTVTSNDIRAGAAMVIAGLCASGETVITDVHYIERGYEGLEKKLTALGAKIQREEE